MLAGILTVLALPAYRNYVLNTQSRMAAALLDQAYQRWQEHTRANPRQHLLSLQPLGFPASTLYLSWDGAVHAAPTGGETYRISLSEPTDAAAASCRLAASLPRGSSLLIAQPVGMQQTDRRCGRLCMSTAGEREVGGAAGVETCWGGSS